MEEFCMELELWQGIALVVVIIVAVYICSHVFTKYHYICPNCSKTFKPASFAGSAFAMNMGQKRKVRCPHCNTKDWALAVKDKENK
jgi:DNA-directed RNA polymerase subunit RPC12/RpoP